MAPKPWMFQSITLGKKMKNKIIRLLPVIGAYMLIAYISAMTGVSRADGATSTAPSNDAPSFAHLESASALPENLEINASKEYQDGHSSYKVKAALKSKLRSQKAIRIEEGGEKFWIFAFPQEVHLIDGFGENGVDVDEKCDVIQYRESDGATSIIPQGDQGRCVSYLAHKPMVMDLNNDGHLDVVFAVSYVREQVGGNYDTTRAFLFDPSRRTFCYSSRASKVVDGGPYDNPVKLYSDVMAYIKSKNIALACDSPSN